MISNSFLLLKPIEQTQSTFHFTNCALLNRTQEQTNKKKRRADFVLFQFKCISGYSKFYFTVHRHSAYK